jgi:hypothetical protein
MSARSSSIRDILFEVAKLKHRGVLGDMPLRRERARFATVA